MKKIIVLCFTFLLLCGCSQRTSVVSMIDADSVYNEINNNNVYIIDVRSIDEYSSGHIENAYNIPLNVLDNIKDIIKNLDSKIIVYCQSGNRSSLAAKRLIQMGYTNVNDMGGIVSWNYDLITE